FEHPQIVARNVVNTVEHPRLGTMKVTRNPVLLDHDGPGVPRPSPMLGEHSQAILTELGYDAAMIGALVSSGVTKLATPVQPKITAAEEPQRSTPGGFARPGPAVSVHRARACHTNRT